MSRISEPNRFVLASVRDRARLENSPLGKLIHFVDRDMDASLLCNVFPLLAVAASSAGATEIAKIVGDQMRSLRSVPDVPTIRLDPDNIDADAALVGNVIEGSVGHLASLTMAMTSELAMLRREREVLFENYRALEDAFRARNWEPATEIFTLDPFVDPKEEGIGQLLRDTYVEQRFPASSYGVSGYALHFRKQTQESGELIFALDCVETDAGIAEWVVPFASIQPDWNFFSLAKACDGSPQTLRLRVSATGGQPPGPSLGHPISNERYAAHAPVAHGDLGQRPLALRIFTGLPGVRPTGLVNVLAPTAMLNGRRIEDYRLPADLLQAVVNVSVTPVAPDFDTVCFLNGEDAILCHPLQNGISAGVLNGAVSPGTVRYSARAVIDHPHGQPAAVGILLAPPAADLHTEVAALGGNTARMPLFSGWRDVVPEQPTNINVFLEAPLPEPMNMVVVSRATTGSVDFSWLKVRDFRMVRHCHAAG